MKAIKVRHFFVGLFAAVMLFTAGNVMYANWTNPPQSPPGGNTPAPINIGSITQVKTGILGATEFRSNRYCDSTGQNCVLPGGGAVPQFYTSRYQPAGYTDTTSYNLGQHLFCAISNVQNAEDTHYCRVWQSGDNWYIQGYKTSCAANCLSLTAPVVGSWQTGSWSAWSSSTDYCGATIETRTRTVQCRHNNTTVGDAFCSPPRPESTQIRTYGGGGCGP